METTSNHPPPPPPPPPISSSSRKSSSISDLAAAISLVKDVAASAESAIKSVSSFLNPSSSSPPPPPPPPPAVELCSCPYNTRHRVPPESLFRHSLLCSSSPRPPLDDLGRFLHTLRYTSSLSENHQGFTNYSLLRDASSSSSYEAASSSSSSDLCFSLDDGGGDDDVNAANFFYKGCPGVVSFPNPDPRRRGSDSTNRTVLLPSILSSECADFMHQPDDAGVAGETDKASQMPGKFGRILPSELWALRCEIEAWTDYPTTYSYVALRVSSTLGKIKESDLKRWIISNSPRFGIVIDSAMGDHVFLLFKLCLKSIRTEALCHRMPLLQESDKISLSNLKDASFDCPKLAGSLAWLASQLSILYGEANARSFTIGMLKQSILCVGLNSMLLKFGQANHGQDYGGSTTGDGALGKECEYVESISSGRLEVENDMKDCDVGRVFVSQIAAAIAALHERLSFEERIEGIRSCQTLPKAQLVTECLYTSKRACEIRENRPNYRAISEHDWFLWQRANNQDLGKAKTREELLAEERDYKRRRMSYRGKKVKRNPTEVLRDIIEEHMEEIVHAGGIGYNMNSMAGVDVLPINQNSRDRTANIPEVEHCKHDISVTKPASPGYEKPHHLYSNDRSKIAKVPRCTSKKLILEYSEHQEGHNRSKHREEKCGFKIPSIHGNYVDLSRQFTHLNEQGKRGADEIKFQRKCSADNLQSRDPIGKSTSKSVHDITNQGHKHMSDTVNINRGETKSFRSKSVIETGFEDRYDPSASHDW